VRIVVMSARIFLRSLGLARNIGFVTNATEGITPFLRSLKFRAGDELLTTNHVYKRRSQGKSNS